MASWQFRPLNPNENSGISTVEDNFANEDRSSVEILVRETLQNPLDARVDSELVEVRYNLVSLRRDSSLFMSSLFSDESLKHFSAGGLVEADKLPEVIEFLIIEDFGTSGLEGRYDDSGADGESQNWNAFWFREGEGAKPTRSNGGAGQGKITLYAASKIRSVIALTHRASDSQQMAFGCCRFRKNYKIDGGTERWSKEARWTSVVNPNILALPIFETDLIDAMKKELGLTRLHHAGTSFIVPMPIGIILSDIKKAVINEFFFPIKRQRLKVKVGECVIDDKSVTALAADLGESGRYPLEYRHFLEKAISEHIDKKPTAVAKSNWTRNASIAAEAFDENELNILKKNFEQGKIISVNFPVKIRKKNSEVKNGGFRVVLSEYLGGEQSQELFIRQDLGIDGEKRLKGARRIQPVLALTFIEDIELSSFLVAAEEPTHRTWNAKRPKVMSLYDGTSTLMNLVRNAALRLVEFLTPSGVRNSTALALYFSDPQKENIKQSGTRGTETDHPNGDKKTIGEIPKTTPKPFEFETLPDGFFIRAIPSVIKLKKLPICCEIITAYATTLGDPFKQWDAAEYWLNNEKEFFIEGVGISELERDGNVIRFKLANENSNFKITGFDSNRKVEVQINYRESLNAEDFENN